MAAFVISLLATAYLAFAPMVASVSESVTVAVGEGEGTTPDTRVSSEVRHQTLPETQGWGAVAIIGGPLLLLTGVPLAARRRRAALLARGTSTLLLFAGVVLGALSFGILYLPGAVLMLVATLWALQAGVPRESSAP